LPQAPLGELTSALPQTSSYILRGLLLRGGVGRGGEEKGRVRKSKGKGERRLREGFGPPKS